MSADAGFALHPGATQDITGIWEYIAKDSPLAAGRVRQQMLSGIHALVQFPHQGHWRPDLTSRPLRFTLVREYVIAYAPEKKPLWVVAVFHGRRSPRLIAAILKGRESARSVPQRLPRLQHILNPFLRFPPAA